MTKKRSELESNATERLQVSALQPSEDRSKALDFLSAIRVRLEKGEVYTNALVKASAADVESWRAYRRISAEASKLATKQAARRFAAAVKDYSLTNNVPLAKSVQPVARLDPVGFRAYRSSQSHLERV